MNIKILHSITMFLFLGASLGSNLAHAIEFGNKWYGGFGLGITDVEPESNGSVFSVADSSSNGYKLFFGRDLSDRLSVEGFFNDLGEARIAPAGSVDYQVYGASAIYHIFSSTRYQFDQRQGYSLFGSAGLGGMRNESTSNVQFERDNDFHLHLGAGVEYGFAGGFALRGHLEFFDQDAEMLSVSLVKRFGRERGSIPLTDLGSNLDTGAPEVVPLPAGPVDSDGDGVPDDLDNCEGTDQGTRVDDSGCPFYAIDFENIHFDINSSVLRPGAIAILDETAIKLSNAPGARIEVQGHTDSTESENYNVWLSNRRSRRVFDYLKSKGIAAQRMQQFGYGETRPINTNGTRAGRAQNRRVQFELME